MGAQDRRREVCRVPSYLPTGQDGQKRAQLQVNVSCGMIGWASGDLSRFAQTIGM